MHSSYLQRIVDRLAHSCEVAKNRFQHLDSEVLNWQPEPGRWSIAQCLDHMSIAAEHYNGSIGPAIEKAKSRQHATGLNPDPRFTLIGRLIIYAVSPQTTRKMKAPRSMRPSSAPITGDPVARFVRAHEATIALAHIADGMDTNRIRMSSPEARILRINATDAFEILAAHAARHLNQAHRVAETPGFSG